MGDVANAIEEAYPGHVVGVNVPVRDAAGFRKGSRKGVRAL